MAHAPTQLVGLRRRHLHQNTGEGVKSWPVSNKELKTKATWSSLCGFLCVGLENKVTTTYEYVCFQHRVFHIDDVGPRHLFASFKVFFIQDFTHILLAPPHFVYQIISLFFFSFLFLSTFCIIFIFASNGTYIPHLNIIRNVTHFYNPFFYQLFSKV